MMVTIIACITISIDIGTFSGKETHVKNLLSRAASVALAGLLAFSGTPAVALAGYVDKPIVAQADLPAKFDLRSKGFVTPVKNQSPWGSCWAFGGIAAAETSILSKMGKTYSEYPLDLSERHLAWYGVMPVTEGDDATQAGEGLYLTTDDNIFDVGGFNVFISTLFSSGTGPVREQLFPYRGATGLLESDYYRQNRDAFIDSYTDAYVEDGYDEATAKAMATKSIDDYIKDLETEGDYYSSSDDWDVPEADEDGTSNRNIFDGFILRDGNVLSEPAKRNDKGEWTGVDNAAITAMKNEILGGNGIEINYAADVSSPGEVENGHYMNLDKWAQYTFDDASPNHAVCIIGWDDTYPASNFTHKVFVEDEDGNYKEDPEGSKKSTPPGNGAWIVKNSWGSETNAVNNGLTTADGRKLPANYQKWGVTNSKGENSGYFYLSYYDKTIKDPETYEFDLDFNGKDLIYVSEYDYMPSLLDFWTLESKNNLSTANEFVADDDQMLTSVSTRTTVSNSKVDFKVYKLDKNQVKPESGQLVAEFSKTFQFAGYHRADLPKPVQLDEGQRFSVVATAYSTDAAGKRTYGVAASAAFDEDVANDYGSNTYAYAVVNPHESFLKIGDNWVDWSSYINSASFAKTAPIDDGNGGTIMPIVDNFAIKAFSLPAAKK